VAAAPAALDRGEPPDEQAVLTMVMAAMAASMLRLIAATMRKRLSGSCESAVRWLFFTTS
jgi:hypothetical protein